MEIQTESRFESVLTSWNTYVDMGYMSHSPKTKILDTPRNNNNSRFEFLPWGGFALSETLRLRYKFDSLGTNWSSNMSNTTGHKHACASAASIGKFFTTGV